MAEPDAGRPTSVARSLDESFFRMLQSSQFWPAAALAAYQRERLADLLHFTRTRVPFYSARLAGVFSADGSIDWSRWAEIPALRREDLLNDRAAMLAPALPKVHGPTHEFSTSGSTSGTPVTVTVSRLANMVTQCCGFRAQGWHGLDWSKTALSWTGEIAEAVWPDGRSLGRWGPRWSASSTGEMLCLTRSTPAEQVLEFVRRREVRYILSRPRSLQALALDALSRDDPIQLDKLVSFGTATTPDERQDCLTAFGTGMYGSYSSKEAGMIAHDCPSASGMHVNSEAVLVEIVDAHDRPVPPGTIGRVLVTPFHNFAQPLIRYDQGDLGVMGTICNCGRTLPVLTQIVGRETDLFRFPDGQVMAPVVPDDLRGMLGAQYWQLVQIGPLCVEVRYVPFRGATADEAAAADMVRRQLRSDLDVSFSRRETLDRVDGGKFKQYAYEAPADGTHRGRVV